MRPWLSTSILRWIRPPTYNYGGLNIDQNSDLPDLRGSINDLLGRVGLIQQGYVAKDANTWALAGTFLHADFRMPEYDAYVQDTWRMRPNFVVDLGLRWEIKLSPRVTNANNMLRPNPPSDGDSAVTTSAGRRVNSTRMPGKTSG